MALGGGGGGGRSAVYRAYTLRRALMSMFSCSRMLCSDLQRSPLPSPLLFSSSSSLSLSLSHIAVMFTYISFLAHRLPQLANDPFDLNRGARKTATEKEDLDDPYYGMIAKEGPAKRKLSWAFPALQEPQNSVSFRQYVSNIFLARIESALSVLSRRRALLLARVAAAEGGIGEAQAQVYRLEKIQHLLAQIAKRTRMRGGTRRW